MSGEVLALALVVGAANWAFRYLPIRFGLGSGRPEGVMARFLAAVGPAAIATLFVAAALPFTAQGDLAAPLAGTAAVVAVWFVARSVVGATLAGAAAYAAVFALVT